MPKPKPLRPLCGVLLVTIALFLSLKACDARTRTSDCGLTMCGNVSIRYPFRLKTQPLHCGAHVIFQLDCDEKHNRTILGNENGKFYVQEILYNNFTIRLVDTNLASNSCSLPRSSAPVLHNSACLVSYSRPYVDQHTGFKIMHLVNCTRSIKSSKYVDASPCSDSSSGHDPPSSYHYFLDERTQPLDFSPYCTVIARVPVMAPYTTDIATLDIYEKLSLGFQLSWRNYIKNSGCHEKYTFHRMLETVRDAFLDFVNSFNYYLFHHSPVTFGRDFYSVSYEGKYVICLGIIGGIALSRTFLGISILIGLVTYKLRRRHLCADDKIEEFLRNQNNLIPIRYSYNEIKRMTRGFSDKLGAGGFGSVFKGKLRSDHDVAVKLLDKSKANGQDFIAEVATIGRIHHVNVANLRGFCVEGSKQALVYDFMPNGSLDKIIFEKENKTSLSWDKMFDIVIGVARGIAYLHQGCDMQILHFDIKPHNILLEENFVPKVSDFGLAKLYSVDDSIVSLTAARGTIGYIAPELIYKNLGGISYKADVYSFGMLLIEMVGKRKNLNAYAEHSSQIIYFPSWIYDQLHQGEDIDWEEVTNDEKMIVKKMAIIAFWCIQMKPCDRPSMNKVLEMLETNVELLQMPPKPFQQLPFELPIEDHVDDNPNDEDPTTSLLSTSEISLEVA
ncbi:hypothetical protein ES319_A05G302500v1 [Gossypium barbadense]|uniref:Protein kinase domain-containing protein n=1 Tax=Gossypium barbadense TaxID=3634 RepID=A0A2P5WEK3_GOSBA|nr:hypothetical protein ES319_A05G302500v1 [Gossypium barbadense]PPR89520.1 hypothetical protein GOBAR_AA31166 [Gossypium barbadense]